MPTEQDYIDALNKAYDDKICRIVESVINEPVISQQRSPARKAAVTMQRQHGDGVPLRATLIASFLEDEDLANVSDSGPTLGL